MKSDAKQTEIWRYGIDKSQNSIGSDILESPQGARRSRLCKIPAGEGFRASHHLSSLNEP
jgi:hypothetical protein